MDEELNGNELVGARSHFSHKYSSQGKYGLGVKNG